METKFWETTSVATSYTFYHVSSIKNTTLTKTI